MKIEFIEDTKKKKDNLTSRNNGYRDYQEINVMHILHVIHKQTRDF